MTGQRCGSIADRLLDIYLSESNICVEVWENCRLAETINALIRSWEKVKVALYPTFRFWKTEPKHGVLSFMGASTVCAAHSVLASLIVGCPIVFYFSPFRDSLSLDLLHIVPNERNLCGFSVVWYDARRYWRSVGDRFTFTKTRLEFPWTLWDMVCTCLIRAILCTIH